MATSRRPHLVADSPKQSAFPLSRRVGLLLRLAEIGVCDLLHRYLDPPDITMVQFAILALIRASAAEFVAERRLCATLRISADEMLRQTMGLVDRQMLNRKTAAEFPHDASFAITDHGCVALELVSSRAIVGHEILRQEFTEQEWEDGLRFLMRLSRFANNPADCTCGTASPPIPRFE